MDPKLYYCGTELPVFRLHYHAAQVATGLHDAGLVAGDRIAIMMRNDAPYLEAMFGSSFLGVYAASLNWHLKGEEVAAIVRDCGAKMLVVHADLYRRVKASLPSEIRILCAETPAAIRAQYRLSEEESRIPEGLENWHDWRDSFDPWTGDPAGIWKSLIYTSGTTGTPKGVLRYIDDPARAEQLLRELAAAFGLEPGKKVVMCGPLYHSATNGYTSCALKLGNDVVLMERFDAEELLQVIERYKITHLHMVPTMFVRLLQLPQAVRDKYDLSSLEHVTHGAAPCPLDVKRQMIDWWGPVINEYYGATECGLMATISSAEWLDRPGSVGRARPGTEIRIYDETGALLPAGEIGDIYVKNIASDTFTYYQKDDLKTAISRDGFVTNGDMGYLDEAGYLYICDRRKDMIISGGVNIFPVEIEDVLSRHPLVRDCAVFGIPHPEYGEEIVAAIESDGEIPVSELQNLVREHLADYKVPRQFRFYDHLAREDSGKIFKRKIREDFL